MGRHNARDEERLVELALCLPKRTVLDSSRQSNQIVKGPFRINSRWQRTNMRLRRQR